MKILANDGLASDGVNLLESAGFTVVTQKVAQEDLSQAINNENYEVLLVRSATQARKELIDLCPGLKLIGRGGVGMDNIDVAYAESKGVKVINTPAASSQSVAELVFAHLFGICRFLPESNRKMQEQGSIAFGELKKNFSKGIELRGKTIGIIGFGRIGQSVASYAFGMGMNVLAYDAYDFNAQIKIVINGKEITNIDVSLSSLQDVLAKSDFITVHTPAQADGKALIGEKEINSMKDGAILINASRGGIVDEDALLNALKSGKLRGAGLDVFKNEPTPRKDLLMANHLSLSPHTGAATLEAQNRVATELAEQIIATFQPA
ncbi:MAG: D-2-hydroxyacid dehydrogenase [Vicingaceae bacterium]